MTFRTLYADEIECRVQTVVYAEDGNKGCSLLLYKDARCDMNILDETVGAFRWQRNHSRDNSNCTVSIWDEEKKQWIEKEDTGTESNTEKEKGLASDSFKRACVNWGIGRELYTAPFIWIDGNLIEWKKDSKGKMVPKTTFSVDYIDYDDKRRISALAIKTNKGNIVWNMGKKTVSDKPERQSNTVQKEPKLVPVICPKCEKEMKPVKCKDGSTMQPIDILAQFNMCPACLKKMSKNESKNQ